jgi:nucleoside-diphosphate-sugar epimerase
VQPAIISRRVTVTMRILVTGGIGSVGRGTVARLLRLGHEVGIVDWLPEEEISEEVREDIRGATYAQVDITDFASLSPHFTGVKAVVHLAAFAHPAGASEVEIFRVNCQGAFNIYRAAADAGISRVVSASSINALGYNYGITPFPIEYFPIDEAHPTSTTDPYSFSKRVLEEIADYFWRREGISGVCLRLPAVIRVSSRWGGRMREFAAHRKQAFDTLMALPEGERRARVDAVIAASDARRAERLSEKPWTGHPRHREGEIPAPEQLLMFGRSDFWAVIHAEDASQAIEKGVSAEYEGSHPLFVNVGENSVGVPSRALAELYFPEVREWRRHLEAAETLVSIERARELIGFEPTPWPAS